ncbi:MAG: hypothetical protein M0Z40_08605 [Actinomycetota bacterium]|nr:hypothetical protein [Actinomycetota bacterium]
MAARSKGIGSPCASSVPASRRGIARTHERIQAWICAPERWAVPSAFLLARGKSHSASGAVPGKRSMTQVC